MSVPSTLPSDHPEKEKSKSSVIWIALSFLLSASILAWAFTLPFRTRGQPRVSSIESERVGHQIDLADRIEQRRTVAEEFRDSAIALDREFMRSLAKSNERKPVPGIREAKQRWSQRVEAVQRRAAELKDAKKGSVEWIARQELLESLQDGPQ